MLATHLFERDDCLGMDSPASALRRRGLGAHEFPFAREIVPKNSVTKNELVCRVIHEELVLIINGAMACTRRPSTCTKTINMKRNISQSR